LFTVQPLNPADILKELHCNYLQGKHQIVHHFMGRRKSSKFDTSKSSGRRNLDGSSRADTWSHPVVSTG